MTCCPTLACTCRLSLLKTRGQWQEWRAFARIDYTPATCSGNLKRACKSVWAASEAKAVGGTDLFNCTSLSPATPKKWISSNSRSQSMESPQSASSDSRQFTRTLAIAKAAHFTAAKSN